VIEFAYARSCSVSHLPALKTEPDLLIDEATVDFRQA
jgi:hypothetical protein